MGGARSTMEDVENKVKGKDIWKTPQTWFPSARSHKKKLDPTGRIFTKFDNRRFYEKL